MGDHTTDATAVPVVEDHDGTDGNLLTRAEPKVRVASTVALLTPVISFELLHYVPGLANLSPVVDAFVATLLTGLLTFIAGYLTRPVNRIDLFVTKAEASVRREVTHAVGAQWEGHLEDWVHDVATAVTPAVHAAETAVLGAVHAVSGAAAAGTDPIVAARLEAPHVKAALAEAAARAAADAKAAAERAAREAAATELADRLAKVSGGEGTDELIDAIRKGLDALDVNATPIGDAARDAVPTAIDVLPALPVPAPVTPVQTPEVPAAPVTQEIPVQPAVPPTA